MCAAGVDGSELWWASNRSATLSAFDLFLESRRTVDDDTAAGGTSSAGHAAHKSKARCFGGCLGDVTAIAAEESSALLWTGTDWGVWRRGIQTSRAVGGGLHWRTLGERQ